MQRSVAITGCSSGFGRILVGLFLKDGWQVVAGMRRAQERADLFAAERALYPKQLHLVDCDLTDEASLDAFAQHTQSLSGGSLHALINNAGLGSFGPAELTTTEDLRASMETNFFGSVRLTRLLLPALRQAEGHIIVLSSIMGMAGFPLSSSYCASKFALEGYFESLYYEIADQKVKVCLVEPGGHRTNFLSNSTMAENSVDLHWSYPKLVKGYKTLQRKVSERKPIPPETVCVRILNLANNPNPPLRSYCGKDAQGIRLFHKFLPRNLVARILRAMYQKVFARLAAQGSRA